MGKFTDYIASFDQFGPHLLINYKGKSQYHTILGSVFTILLNTFVLVFAVLEVKGLVLFDDPKISTVSCRLFVMKCVHAESLILHLL